MLKKSRNLAALPLLFMNGSLQPLFVTFAVTIAGSRDPVFAKILASSLLRSLFTGSIHVLSNDEMPLYKVARKGLDQAVVPPARQEGQSTDSGGGYQWLLDGVQTVLRPEPRQWVIVANAAGMALRNIDHLISSISNGPQAQPEIDLYWTTGSEMHFGTKRAPAASGLWAVRGEHLPLVLGQWEEAWSKERELRNGGEIWTDVMSKLPLRKRPFEKGEVYAPRIGAVDWEALSNAAFVTVPDWPEKEQWKFLQALYFGTYFGDETGLMLNILDP